MKRIYLDYAATTPLDKEVKKAMEPYFSNQFGNPNSLHYFGQEARGAIDMSRQKIAESIGASFEEIIFTSSATEANNLALRGIFKYLNIGTFKNVRPRIIISAIEHDSVLETAKDLEREGVDVVILPVNKKGIIDLKKLKESLDERTVLVSIMYANNETGSVQNIKEISKIISTYRDSKLQIHSNSSNKSNTPIQQYTNSTTYPLFHTDAVQAFQFLNCNVNDLGVDMMTLSAHKIYGPKGTGMLYVKSDERRGKSEKKIIDKNSLLLASRFSLFPIMTGGGQEFGLRSGTENVAGIVGMTKAIELANKNREKEYKRIGELKNYFTKELKKIYPSAQINADKNADLRGNKNSGLKFLPNITNIYFPDFKNEDLLIKLDMAGMAVSSGSACTSFAAKPSHVLKAMGFNDKRTKSSLRFSFGKFTTKDEIKQTLKILKGILV